MPDVDVTTGRWAPSLDALIGWHGRTRRPAVRDRLLTVEELLLAAVTADGAFERTLTVSAAQDARLTELPVTDVQCGQVMRLTGFIYHCAAVAHSALRAPSGLDGWLASVHPSTKEELGHIRGPVKGRPGTSWLGRVTA